MAYKGSLVELLLFGTYCVWEHVYIVGNHLVIQSRMSRTSTFWLACTEYRLVPDISLFRDGNNPGKPFCTALLRFSPAYLGYNRYMHNHICVLACNDPLLYRSR